MTFFEKKTTREKNACNHTHTHTHTEMFTSNKIIERWIKFKKFHVFSPQYSSKQTKEILMMNPGK